MFCSIEGRCYFYYDKSEVKWNEVALSCLTLWDPTDCSPPGSPVPGKSTGVGCHCLLQLWQRKAENGKDWIVLAAAAGMYVCVCCRFGFILCPLYVLYVRETSRGIRVVPTQFSTVTQMNVRHWTWPGSLHISHISSCLVNEGIKQMSKQ